MIWNTAFSRIKKEDNMEHFIYSIHVTVPIFFVMAVGWVCRRTGMLNDAFVAAANRFNFTVTLPAMLFLDMSSVDIYGTFDAGYVLFCAAASTACLRFFRLGLSSFRDLPSASRRKSSSTPRTKKNFPLSLPAVDFTMSDRAISITNYSAFASGSVRSSGSPSVIRMVFS